MTFQLNLYGPLMKIIAITECDWAQGQRIFWLNMLIVMGLKAQKGLQSLNGNVQHASGNR